MLSSSIPPYFLASRSRDPFWGFLQIIPETNCISQARWKHYGLFATGVMAFVSGPLFFALILSFLLFYPSASLRRSRSRARYTRASRTGVGYTGYCTADFHYLRVSTMRTLPSITYLSLSVFLISVRSYSLLIVETRARQFLKSTA